MFSVLIRPLREEDSPISYKWRNDQNIWRFTGKKPDRLITEEIECNWIKRVLSESDSYRFAILADEKYVGNIQLTGIKAGEEGEYHIFIGERSYWGKGIAWLASLQLIRFAREFLRLKRIFLYVNPENNAAIRVYEKLGFIKVSDEIKMVYDLGKELKPMVSVFMITYNHEPYIGQAIESILAQKTNFDFDIVIGEDCSTDNTRKIVLGYAEKKPGKIKPLLHEQNIGAIANQMAVFSACTGKYIAICEGDDYWTDPLKLQKQVDFLEANPEYGLVYSDFKIIDKEGNDIDQPAHKSIRERYQEGYVFTELLKGNFINTCSVVFRKELMPGDIYVSEKSWFIYDYWLWLRVATKSKIHFINEATAAYRFHDGGVSHSNGFKDKRKFYNLYFDIIESFNRENAQSLIREEQGVLFRKLLSLLRQPYGTISQKLKILKMMLVYFPGFSNTFKMLRHKYPNSL
jgi:glycosyltransferase involved in cell wall biosynthesis/RimJ/RimL family protein N-acetyltransferase